MIKRMGQTITLIQEFRIAYKKCYDLVNEILKLRTAQVTYFKQKGRDNLIKAKDQEITIDKVLEDPDLNGLFTNKYAHSGAPLIYMELYGHMLKVVQLARIMRKAQKHYFSYRGRAELKASKAAEQALDDQIRSFLSLFYDIQKKKENGTPK